jgi:hypothetical protein
VVGRRQLDERVERDLDRRIPGRERIFDPQQGIAEAGMVLAQPAAADI